MMSPRIVPLERKDPSQPCGRGGDETGTISATGSPERVIRTGCPVRCTLSSTAVQTALNFEIVMLSTTQEYHDPIARALGEDEEAEARPRELGHDRAASAASANIGS